MTLRRFIGLGSIFKSKKTKKKKDVELPDNYIVGSTSEDNSKTEKQKKTDGDT